MQKISEISFGSDLKIVDVFELPEEFGAQYLSNVQEGLWCVFNEMTQGHTDDDEDDSPSVKTLILIEKNFFEQQSNPYDWQSQPEPVSLEKGVVGVLNKSYVASDDHYDEVDTAISNEFSTGLLNHSGVVCQTPEGNDGYYAWETTTKHGRVVALRIHVGEAL